MSGDSSLLAPHGNYRELLFYQKAEVVSDLTFQVCQRFLNQGGLRECMFQARLKHRRLKPSLQ